eukprot:scaffold1978_cov144-Skeletonema_menzelii.AAC.5
MASAAFGAGCGHVTASCCADGNGKIFVKNRVGGTESPQNRGKSRQDIKGGCCGKVNRIGNLFTPI